MRIHFSSKFKDDISRERTASSNVVGNTEKWIKETAQELGLESKIELVCVLINPEHGGSVSLASYFNGVYVYLNLNLEDLSIWGKKLVMHEFGHIKDKLMPEFAYSPEKEIDNSNSFLDKVFNNILNEVWNVSLEKRLEKDSRISIGKMRAKIDFACILERNLILGSTYEKVMQKQELLFNEMWKAPPETFQEILDKTNQIITIYPRYPDSLIK